MTIVVSGNYVVGAGQTLTYTDPTSAVYTVDGVPLTVPATNFTDQGSITVSSALSGVSLIALTDGPPGGPLSGSLIKIDQTASLSVIATGSGASAYGYNSSPSGAAFENDGVFNVAGVAYGQGIQLGRNQSSIHPDFLNTGQFTTSANVAWAVEGTGSLIYMNSGIVEADGGAQAIAFDLATPNSLTSLSNSGTITATASAGTSYGIRIDGGFYSPGQVMGIKNTGTITAQHAIAEITTNAISVLLTNSGAMNGDIVLQDGSSTLAGTSGSQIINTGSIGGAIHFNGNANDVYDGRGGTQTGGIYLGAGTDTAYLGNDGETVIGGSGGAAIIGGTGADTITGGSGADLIDGGGGADILAGGLGADEFLVRTATGSATITDFSHAQGDKIDLLALGTFFSLSDVLTHAARSGSDTVITLGSGTLTLKNILPEALTAQDFTFTNQGNSNTVLVNTYTRITGAHLISGPLGGFPAYNVISGAFISDAFILLQDVGRAVIGVTSIVGATFDAGSTLEVHATGFNNSNTATGYIGIGGYVGNSGVISAWGSAEADAVAIRLQGSNSTGANTVTNSGTISASADVSASAYGIQYSGPARGNVTQIFNSGTITAQHAISAQSSAASFPGQDPALRLTNSGTINGDIEMGYGPLAIANVTNLYDHQITNTGAINGAIHLSTNGNDYYDGRGGTLTGGLYLAGGDSTIYLGNDGETVYAGAGGVALITGGTGADTITTGAAADTIDGGGGNDVLTGGLGADTFVFSKASGQAAVTDFSDAQGDRIDLSSMLRFFSLGDILAASHQSGADAVIDLGSGASLTLRNVQLSGLADSDFILTPIKIHGGASLVIPAGATLSSSASTYQAYLQPIVQLQAGSLAVNNGTLSVTSTGAFSIVGLVSGDFYGETFTNNGQITGANSGYGSGGALVTTERFINTGTVTATNVSVFGGESLTNSGHISLTGSGLAGNAYGPEVRNLAGGVITSDGGLVSDYNGGVFDNAGTITIAAGSVVRLGRAEVRDTYGDLSKVSNSGVITVTGTGTGFDLNAYGGIDTNFAPAGQYNVVNSGTITATTAISFRNLSDGGEILAAIDNSGVLNGTVITDHGHLMLHNTGTINGDVTLGNRAGYGSTINVDSGQGTINGVLTLGPGSATVALGAEDNTVVLGAVPIYVLPGQTIATVLDGGGGTNALSYALASSGVTVNLTLQGSQNAGGAGTETISNFQKLVGSNYGDLLGAASTGTSTLTGGTGADIFRVTTALTGAVAVSDFSQAQGDKIDLGAFGALRAFADVQGAAQQVGSDTVITLGSGTLTLTGITLANLVASDFVLPLAAHASFDLTGDHHSDLLFRNPASGDWGYAAMTATGFSWRDIGVTSAAYAIDGTGDFNGDGVADILFHNHVSGDWGFAAMTAAGGVAWHGVGVTSAAYSIDATGDFNGDGVADILFRNHATGDWGFAAMDRNGGLVWNDKGVTTMTYSIDGTGDFNGDGVADVLLRNHATGDWGFAALDRNGGVSWTDVGITSTAYPVAGLGDFNGDGTTDVLFRNPTNGDWGYMAMHRSGAPTWVALGASTTSYAIDGTGDFNGDGTADIVFRNHDSGDWGWAAMHPNGSFDWQPMGASSAAYFIG